MYMVKFMVLPCYCVIESKSIQLRTEEPLEDEKFFLYLPF